MATAVQIQITLDPSGAVTGIKQLGGALDDLGNKAQGVGKKHVDAFNGIESAERRAHTAGMLWTRLTGTEMPRALENVIARSKTAGPILAGLFNAGVVAATGVAILSVVGHLVTMAKEAGGVTAEFLKMKEEMIAANLVAMSQARTQTEAKKHQQDLQMTTAILERQTQAWKDQNEVAKIGTHILAFFGHEASEDMLTYEKRLADSTKALGDLNTNQQHHNREVTRSILESQVEINEAGKHGFALFAQQHIDQKNIIKATFDLESGLSDAQPAKLLANDRKYAAATIELHRQINNEIKAMESDALLARLHGEEKARAELAVTLDKLKTKMIDEQGFLPNSANFFTVFNRAATAAWDKLDADLAEKRRTALEGVVHAEAEANVARLPEWQRADAQIWADYTGTMEKIRVQMLGNDGIEAWENMANRERVAAWQLANTRIRDEHKKLTEELGADLQSVFDDIASGNIGKRILANIEKLFFQIVAQWILSLGIMKSAAGSILGSIVFGPGTTGSNVFGGGSALSLIGGLLGGGSSSSQSAQVGIGGSSAALALPGLGAGSGLAGAAAGTGTSAGTFSASNALTSATMASAAGSSIGSGVSSAAGGKGGILSGLFSAKGLATLAPLAMMLAGGAGGKVGQIGGMLGGLTMSGALGGVISSLYGVLGLAGTGALVGGATGGLLGFGIGMGHGGLLGSLAGAGAGALTGFMVGGPVGAIVGGLIGLLGGIFGGIFGGSKRKKQANAFFDNTVSPGIASIIQGFDSFQIDNSSAIQQLEQLRTDAQKQLSALKGQGNDVFNSRVGPAINDAEKHIRDIQSERDRRSSLVFGPPQFDTGGLFSIMRGGNAGLAVLHNGEFIVNPAATKNNIGELQKMNAGMRGGGSAGPNVTIVVKAIDSRDVAEWLKKGGAEQISKGLNRLIVEGAW